MPRHQPSLPPFSGQIAGSSCRCLFPLTVLASSRETHWSSSPFLAAKPFPIRHTLPSFPAVSPRKMARRMLPVNQTRFQLYLKGDAMRFLKIISLFLASFVASSSAVLAQSTPQEEQQIPAPTVPPSTESIPKVQQVISPRCEYASQQFYASAHRRPLTPHDLAMREAVRALGVDRHRFVHFELIDGRSVTGGILSIGQEEFCLSRGILDVTAVPYSSLRVPPQHDPAPADHFLNGMKWTGLVAEIVVATPVVLVLYYPLVAAGVIKD